MPCPLCKGKITQGKTHLTYDMGEDDVLVVKDVPARICEQCGESFIDIDVVRQVEKIVDIARKNGLTCGFIKYRYAA